MSREHLHKRMILIASVQLSSMEVDRSWYGQPCHGFLLFQFVTLKGRITGEKYREVLADQVHPMMKILFSAGDGIFQDDNALIYAARVVQSSFDEHNDEVEHLPWPVQSPDLNIIEPLWSILEISIRNRYPPPASLTELSQYLHEEWYNIPLNIIQNLYDSIPWRIQAVLHTKGGH